MLAGFSDKLFPARFVGVAPMQNCGCDKLSHVLSNNVLATFSGNVVAVLGGSGGTVSDSCFVSSAAIRMPG